MTRARVAALLALAVVLTGCAGVPTSGPIRQGPVVAPAGEDQFIRVIARPPHDGMTPEEVVSGFEEATASPDAHYTIAREYLTADAATSWDPSAGVLISDANGLTMTRQANVVHADGALSGTIDASGEYAVAAPGSKLSTSYSMELVDGQWRIASPPDGLVLGPADIDRGFRSFDLYYFTRDFGMLVPAPVIVPLTSSGLATALVRSLVAGPTPWIAPAVRTAFPEGTKLALDSVPVIDGVAQVDLTPQVLAADDMTRQKLSAQLVWTLRPLPDISGVQITVNGQPLPVSGVAPIQPVGSWPLLDPQGLPDQATGYAVDRRGILRVAGDGALTPVARTKPDLVFPGVSLDSSKVAGLSADGRSLYEAPLDGTATAVRRYTGTQLSRPSWDRSGAIWFVDRGTGLVVVQAGKAARVGVGGLPPGVTDASLLSAAVSRDGTRLALLVRRGTRVEPMIARIERFGDNVRVTAPRRTESIITEAIDLAWEDADTLAVLGTSGASSLEVLQLDVGSPQVRRMGAPEGAVTLAAAPGRALLVGTATSVFRNTGSTWTRVGDAQYPVYPG
ncbi:MAG TPA: LpqB family beta-propeller domain-containing protein [Candidatus Angelobacter sp.]|nr:LpqB family beta-propeller domain-containing protein [Candidatus Angelobacter sp.]